MYMRPIMFRIEGTSSMGTFTSWGEEIEEGEIVEPNTSMKRTLSEDSQTSAETMEQTQTKDDKLKQNRKKNK